MTEPETREPNIVIVEQPTRTQYVDRHVTITEKRAPTDDSVKLLREMEQKAEAEVIKAVQIGNATFECVVHQSRDMMSDLMRWRAVFKLNGKQMIANIETNPREDGGANLQGAMTKLRDEMAKVIASEVLNDGFVALMRQRMSN
jgi:hypothetical protein